MKIGSKLQNNCKLLLNHQETAEVTCNEICIQFYFRYKVLEKSLAAYSIPGFLISMRQTNLREGAEKYEQLVYKNANTKVNVNYLLDLFTLFGVVNSKYFFMSLQREYENIINSKISQIKEESHHTYMNNLCSFCKNNSFLQCSEFSTLCFVKTQFGWTHDTILGFSFDSKDQREITKDVEQSSQSQR